MAFSGTLKDFLVAVGQNERDLEDSRQKFGQVPTFSVGTLFSRLDRDGNGEITANEI